MSWATCTGPRSGCAGSVQRTCARVAFDWTGWHGQHLGAVALPSLLRLRATKHLGPSGLYDGEAYKPGGPYSCRRGVLLEGWPGS